MTHSVFIRTIAEIYRRHYIKFMTSAALVGQSVNVGDIYQAIIKTADKYGLNVADFAFYADE